MVPARLAAYMATSACLSRSPAETSAVSAEALASPMLARTASEWPSMRNGSVKASTTRLATASGSSAPSSITTAKSFSHAEEQLVTGRVAERVVDEFEVVQVEAEHGQRAQVAALQLDGVLEPVAEQRPVGEAGERVVEGLMHQFVLAGGDGGQEPPVVGQGEELADQDHDDQRQRRRRHRTGTQPWQ